VEFQRAVRSEAEHSFGDAAVHVVWRGLSLFHVPLPLPLPLMLMLMLS
jgi:hypothetical protein